MHPKAWERRVKEVRLQADQAGFTILEFRVLQALYNVLDKPYTVFGEFGCYQRAGHINQKGKHLGISKARKIEAKFLEKIVRKSGLPASWPSDVSDTQLTETKRYGSW